LRVLQLTPATFGKAGLFGGGERFPVELAKAMAKQVPTRLVSFAEHYSQTKIDDLTVTMLPVRHRIRGNVLNPISEKLLGELWSADVIHTHHFKTMLTDLALLTSTIRPARVFTTDHGGGAPHLSPKLGLGRRLTKLLAVSSFSSGLFPQFAAKTEVIYGGVDPEKFFPDGTERQRSAVFVGRMMPHKGVDVLIRALPAGLPLHLYGRSNNETYLVELRRLAEGKNVHFHLAASDEEILQAYRRATVSVLPSVYNSPYGPDSPWSELLGLALLEAMACGTPVIASDVGGMPEIVTDGEYGRIVPPRDVAALRDALEEIVDAGPGWQKMSDAALDAVSSRFTWDKVADRCLRAYTDAY
jgi:glycosyltransferase involved in cell wall biosynthesis